MTLRADRLLLRRTREGLAYGTKYITFEIPGEGSSEVFKSTQLQMKQTKSAASPWHTQPASASGLLPDLDL